MFDPRVDRFFSVADINYVNKGKLYFPSFNSVDHVGHVSNVHENWFQVYKYTVCNSPLLFDTLVGTTLPFYSLLVISELRKMKRLSAQLYLEEGSLSLDYMLWLI